jgi:hypothetical protein
MQGTEEHPLIMKIVQAEGPPPVKVLAFQIAIVAIPIAIALLMQSPALRQQVQMRVLGKTSAIIWGSSYKLARVGAKLDNAYAKAAM